MAAALKMLSEVVLSVLSNYEILTIEGPHMSSVTHHFLPERISGAQHTQVQHHWGGMCGQTRTFILECGSLRIHLNILYIPYFFDYMSLRV